MSQAPCAVRPILDSRPLPYRSCVKYLRRFGEQLAVSPHVDRFPLHTKPLGYASRVHHVVFAVFAVIAADWASGAHANATRPERWKDTAIGIVRSWMAVILTVTETTAAWLPQVSMVTDVSLKDQEGAGTVLVRQSGQRMEAAIVALLSPLSGVWLVWLLLILCSMPHYTVTVKRESTGMSVYSTTEEEA